MKKETIASLLVALVVGVIGGYAFSESQRPNVYYYASEMASPPAMEDEDYSDPLQVPRITRWFEEELIHQKLKAVLGDRARITVVWERADYQTKCMVEVWGASLRQKVFEDIIRQSTSEAGAKAEKLWAERVAAWKKKEADQANHSESP